MREIPVGEILTGSNHMGEYIAVRARSLPDGTEVGKVIASESDPDMVHGVIRRDIKEHENTGASFKYYFYKPFKPGEDREGWIINGQKERV